MIDFEQIVLIARSQGKTQQQLACLLDINPGHLWRLKRGQHQPNPELVAKAVKLLGIGIGDISRNEPDWVEIAKDDLAQLAVYNEQLRKAESVLTISGSIESYLQDEWMLEFSNREWLGIADWNNHCRFLLPYAQQQRQARSRGQFWHRVVCPWRLFESARVGCIDWLDAIRHGLGDHEEICAVTPVRDWDTFRQMVTRSLPEQANGWGKICVIDSLRIVVHINDRCYLSSSHEATAVRWNRELEILVKQFEPTFLKENEINLYQVRTASLATQQRVEKLLRSREDLELANLNLMAFDRMLQMGRFLPPHQIAERLRKVIRPSQAESTEA